MMVSGIPNGNSANGYSSIRWAAISGIWEFHEASADYLEGVISGSVEGKPLRMGLAVSNFQMQDGTVQAKVSFSQVLDDPQAAGFVLGYQSAGERYILAQLGASNAAYSLSEFDPGLGGWRSLVAIGAKRNLQSALRYLLEVKIVGQRLRVSVDGVRVIEHVLSVPFVGTQFGLVAAGDAKVSFSDVTLDRKPPRVFVAMQFGAPFDAIYKDVIEKEAQTLNLEVIRMDERAGPGIIFEDMQRQISEAKVVIAEITAPNENVFYEVGYAHALNKPTILLAQRGKQLPFDIRSYRVIFYDDSIGGKSEVERDLHKHLSAVLQE
jgi:hypothetical protein